MTVSGSPASISTGTSFASLERPTAGTSIGPNRTCSPNGSGRSDWSGLATDGSGGTRGMFGISGTRRLGYAKRCGFAADLIRVTVVIAATGTQHDASSGVDKVEPRPRSPTAEAADLKSAQCRFESDRGYRVTTLRRAWPASIRSGRYKFGRSRQTHQGATCHRRLEFIRGQPAVAVGVTEHSGALVG
jgi:hypothetical protein